MNERGNDINDRAPLVSARALGQGRGRVGSDAGVLRVAKGGAPGEASAPQNVDVDDKTAAAAGMWIAPPVDPQWLAEQLQYSTIVPQCVAAMAANVEGYGHKLVPTFDPAHVSAEELATYTKERDKAEAFFRRCCAEITFRELTRNTRVDLSTVGWGCWELLRDGEGRLAGLEHVPARTMRKVGRSNELVKVRRKVLALDGSAWEEDERWRRLRLYVQIGLTTADRVYFKEPGDPRRVLAATGEIVRNADSTPQMMEPSDWVDPKYAHELLWLESYDPAQAYGLPPWAGAMISVSGSRSADEVNWLYFDNRGLPPFVVLVSGGVVTPESLKRLEEHFASIRGLENFHRGLILEAIPDASFGVASTEPGSKMSPRIEIKPLVDLQNGDALFQNYDQNNRRKVRSAFGIPPIFVGESDDYSYATARVSMLVAEQSTFGPARALVAERVQQFIMSELDVTRWVFTFAGPKLTDAAEIASLVQAGTAAGVGSPNTYSEAIGSALGVDIPKRKEAWAGVPLPVLQAAVAAGQALVTLDGVTTEGFSGGDEEALDAIRALFERVANRAALSRVGGGE